MIWLDYSICLLIGLLLGFIIGKGRGYKQGWKERNDQAFSFENRLKDHGYNTGNSL